MIKRIYTILSIVIFSLLILYINNQCEYFSEKFIDKCYIINLDRRTDRLKHITEQCKNANIDFERFSACDGNPSKYKNYIDKYFDKNNKLTKSQIGCALSHILIWEKILKNNNKNTLILEDDAIIDVNFWKKIDILNKEINTNKLKFDIIYLQLSKVKCRKISKNICKIEDFYNNFNWGTTGYIINNQFIKKYINNINISQPIDVFIQSFTKKNNIFFYTKEIVIPDFESRSDLWGGIPKNGLDINIFKKKIYL